MMTRCRLRRRKCARAADVAELRVQKDFLAGPPWAVLTGMVVKSASRGFLCVLALKSLLLMDASNEGATAVAEAVAKLLSVLVEH